MKTTTTAIPNILLRQARELRGWSQKFVAEQIDAPAVCYISRWERGNTIPSPFYRERLCRVFGKDARELGFYPNKEPELMPSVTPNSVLPPQKPAFASSDVFLLDTSSPPTTQPPNLIGRWEELQLLTQKLYTEQEKNIIALYGLPGIGKTALARACIHSREVLEHFPDGILWINLGQQPGIKNLLTACSTIAGLTPNDQEQWDNENQQMKVIARAMSSRRMLIVVDDVWAIKDFLPFFEMGGPRCTYLVTSRLPRLSLRLANDKAFAVSELGEKESLEVLGSFVPSLIYQEPQAMHALASSVDGLPLALALMGQYLRSQVAEGQPQRIQAALGSLSQPEGRLRLFEESLSTDHTDHPAVSLRYAIETSAHYLPSGAQNALYALATLPARPTSIAQETALAVARTSIDVLDKLIDTGLLNEVDAGRYTLHPVIIDYVRLEYIDREAQGRLTDYVLHYLEQHCDTDSVLDREQDILQAGIETMFKLRHTHKLLHALSLFVPFLWRKGLYTLSEKYLQQAYQLAMLPENQPKMLPYTPIITCYLAKSIQKRGGMSQARILYQQGLEFAYQCEAYHTKSELLFNLGVLEFEQGMYIKAEACFQKALIDARRYDNQKLLVKLLSYLGEIAAKRGNYAEAQAYFQEGLAFAHQSHYQEGVSILLTRLGQISCEQGRHIEASHYLQSGLEIARQLGYPELICEALIGVTLLALERGNYTQAEIFLHEARELLHQPDSVPLLNCRILQALAMLALKQESYTLAENYLQEGCSITRRTGYLEYLAQMSLLSGIATFHMQDYTQAEAHFDKSLSLGYQLGHSECIGGALIYLGIIANAQKRWQKAEMYLQEGFAIARAIKKRDLLCVALCTMGENCLSHQDEEKATLYFNELLELASPWNQEYLAKAQYGLARASMARGEVANAQKQGQAALALFESLGHNRTHEVRQWLSLLPLLMNY
ncbi:MAG TPA: tetratricopeptide repeat protein [Ktedonobacteraceae bacterium]|nr:tetratricopeptide repeat protein [Ktedonobacteraceae bacterium]